MQPNLEWETQSGYPKKRIAGVDEVGRGCLAGPVVAAVVVLPRTVDFGLDSWLLAVKDSKLIKSDLREELDQKIRIWCDGFAIGQASCREIDQVNILQASHLAMFRAVKKLKQVPHHVLVDGKFVPKEFSEISATPVIKGDQRSLSIACASIIAKVFRDRQMFKLDSKYPGYGFSSHKGYPTQVHLESLRKIGVSDVHRRTFGPVTRILKESHLTNSKSFPS